MACLRIRLKHTQKEVADQLGISRQAIASWEAGKSMPSITQLGDLAILYGTATDYIVFGIKTIPIELLHESPGKVKTAMSGYRAFIQSIYSVTKV